MASLGVREVVEEWRRVVEKSVGERGASQRGEDEVCALVSLVMLLFAVVVRRRKRTGVSLM